MASFIRNLDSATTDLKDMGIALLIVSPLIIFGIFAFAYVMFF